MFYLDPPCWGTEGDGVDFGLEQYDLMACLMGTMKGKAVVSVNDIPEMRQAFKGHHMQRVGIRYSVGAPRAAAGSPRVSGSSATSSLAPEFLDSGLYKA